MKQIVIKLMMSSALLLLIMSLYLASRGSFLYDNFTFVGNQPSIRPFFILWGLLQSLYAYVLFIKIVKVYALRKHFILYATIISTMNIIGIVSPYTIHSNDFFSTLHVLCNMGATLASILLTFLVIKQISKSNYVLGMHFFTLLKLLLAGFSFSFMLLGDIASFGQIILLNGLNALFIELYKKSD